MTENILHEPRNKGNASSMPGHNVFMTFSEARASMRHDEWLAVELTGTTQGDGWMVSRDEFLGLQECHARYYPSYDRVIINSQPDGSAQGPQKHYLDLHDDYPELGFVAGGRVAFRSSPGETCLESIAVILVYGGGLALRFLPDGQLDEEEGVVIGQVTAYKPPATSNTSR